MLKNEIVQLKSYDDKTGKEIGNVLPITNSEAVKVENDKNLKQTLVEINQHIQKTTTSLDNIANMGTTLEVLEKAMEKEIGKQISSGNMTHMAIADGTIDVKKLAPTIRDMFYVKEEQTQMLKFNCEGGLMADGTIGIYGSGWLATDYMEIKCTKIEYRLAGFTFNNITLAGIVFYDESKNFISSITPHNASTHIREDKYGINTYIISGVIEVPHNAKYIRVGNANIKTTNEKPYDQYRLIYIYDKTDVRDVYIKGENILAKDATLNEILDELLVVKNEVKPSFITGGLLVDGSILTNNAWGHTDFISIPTNSNCIFYDTLAFTIEDLTLAGIVFYDDNKQFISSVTPNNADSVEPFYGGNIENRGDYIITGIIDIPLNAKYIKVGGRIGSDKDKYETKITMLHISKKQQYVIDYEHVVANGTISLKDVIKDIHQKLENVSTQNSNWKGKKCAFIGDSITQGVGTTKAYHSYLQESLGIVSYNYGINGAMMSDMYNQIVRVREEHPDIDVIFIFGGTNDYNANIPIGTFYTESVQTVNVNGT